MLTERSKKRGIASERVQSGENDTDVQGGLPLSPSLSLRPSTSLPLSLSSGGWHFPSSVWPLTEGGMNRGVERGERAGRGAKGGWAADGHLNARLPIYWKSGRDGHTNNGWTLARKHGRKQLELVQNAATHLLLVDKLWGIETQPIEVLVHEAPWWPSSLRGAPCNYATMQPTSWVQIWPLLSLCFLCAFHTLDRVKALLL